MNHTTIALALLEADPPLYRRLKAARGLARTLRTLAAAGERSHRGWVTTLAGPDRDPEWVAAVAREFALADLAAAVAEVRAEVLAGGTAGSPEPDAAMAFLRTHTPPA